jgi:hypothetical protein
LKLNLARYKKHAKRTLKELSMFCNLGLLLFVAQIIFGTRKPSRTSWWHVLFFTTSSMMRGIWNWSSSMTILV